MKNKKLNNVAVLGASSFVGQSLLPLLLSAGHRISAFSRRAYPQKHIYVNWVQLSGAVPVHASTYAKEISSWVSVSPIWVLPEYLPWIKSMGAKRVIALSSTSIFTKAGSTDISEQLLAKRIAESEHKFISWAELNNIEWIILRPTLIYGLGLDRNLSEITRFIRRFYFFPVFGNAHGLRQPIHVQDVAQACFDSLHAPIFNRAYNISGGEKLTYREMVSRVFIALERPRRLLSVPLPFFRVTVAILRWLPRYRKWSFAMAERMNQDLVFDHTEATRDFGFAPRRFKLNSDELPQ